MKSSHKAIQARVDAITPRNAPNVPMEFSAEQRREALVKRAKLVTAELSQCAKGTRARKELGQRLAAINKEINAIRPKKNIPGHEKWFIDAAMDILPRATVKMIWDRAAEMKEKWGKNQEPNLREHPWKDMGYPLGSEEKKDD